MSMVQVVLIGLTGVMFALILKRDHPEYALGLILVTGILITWKGIDRVADLMNQFQKILQEIGLEQTYVSTILRMIGVTYLAEFASNICKDAGMITAASQIEIFGKLTILGLSMPIILAIVHTIGQTMS